ncbi:MAG: acetyl-CoA C-acetyltransferase [Gordonia polyisoprenivorans]|nr:acetyl-CoA C-acetyltransferase [Gordonia polyisoprenivorans]
MTTNEALIFDAIRTPRGRGKSTGGLHTVRPVDLVVTLIDELRRRHPNLDPARIDDLVLGVVTPVGEQGGNIANAAALQAGLPEQVSGLQVNRYCASGLEAVNIAAQKIASGWENVVLAGGVESMSRVQMGADQGAYMNDARVLYDNYFVPQGISADLIATLDGYSRDDVDEFAARSHERAAKAWADGAFARSVVPVRDMNGVTVLDHDEHIRPDSTTESLGRLRPSFESAGLKMGFDSVAVQRYHWLEKVDHVHTPGNSSGIVDGAGMVLLGSRSFATEAGIRPRGRVVATALRGAEPTIMLTAPSHATRKLLQLTGLTVDDIDLFELNEAFASVVLRYQRDLAIPEEKLNVNGGAIAMGHALGATGAMLVGVVLDELERRDLHRAVVTLCAGGGMGIATLVERV